MYTRTVFRRGAPRVHRRRSPLGENRKVSQWRPLSRVSPWQPPPHPPLSPDSQWRPPPPHPPLRLSQVSQWRPPKPPGPPTNSRSPTQRASRSATQTKHVSNTDRPRPCRCARGARAAEAIRIREGMDVSTAWPRAPGPGAGPGPRGPGPGAERFLGLVSPLTARVLRGPGPGPEPGARVRGPGPGSEAGPGSGARVRGPRPGPGAGPGARGPGRGSAGFSSTRVSGVFCFPGFGLLGVPKAWWREGEVSFDPGGANHGQRAPMMP